MVFLAGLLVTGVVLAAPTLDWNVIAGGGGYQETANLSLNSTIGQAVVGVVSSGNSDLCAGYWCKPGVVPPPSELVFLPIVLKN